MDMREKIYRNVKALTELNNIRMSEVDKAIGHVAGYLSRRRFVMNDDMLVTLAEMFEISVDDLINDDWEHEKTIRIAVENFRNAAIELRKFFVYDGISMLLKNTIGWAEDDGDAGAV